MSLLGVALIVLVMHVCRIACYPSGAPNSACTSMTPLHHGTYPRNDAPPFFVELSKNTYSPNDVITVTLRSNFTTRFFRGFLVEMRKYPSLQEPIGTFQNVRTAGQTEDKARSMCNTPADSGFTQNDNDLRSSVTSTWTAPPALQGDLQVSVTFVERFDIYWVGVTSLILKPAEETTSAMVTPPPTNTPLPDLVTTTTITPTTTTTTTITTTTTTTTTTTRLPDTTTVTESTVKASDRTNPPPTQDKGDTTERKHNVIGTIESTTSKTNKPKTQDGGGSSGLSLHPFTLVFSGLVCLSTLLLTL